MTRKGCGSVWAVEWQAEERKKERKGLTDWQWLPHVGTFSATTTAPFVVFTLIYYLELCNAITSYFSFANLPTKIK